MVNYISENRKVLVTRNNGINKNLLCLDYDVEASLDFQIVDSNNQLVHIDDNLSGLYLAVGLKLGEPSRDLLALSKDYTISNDTIHFFLQTYTENWLNRVRKASTEAYFELGQMSINQKRVIARDYCYVWPRCYIEGLSPQQIDTQNFYNKTETQELLAQNLAESKTYTDEQIASIDLSEYATDADLQVVSGAVDTNTASISTIQADLATKASESDLQIVSGAVDTNSGNIQELSGDVDALELVVSNKAEQSSLEALSGDLDTHTSNTTIHVTAAEKAAWNGKLDPSALEGYATEQYVNGQVSGKADQSALTAHTSDTEIHTTALEKTAWDAKQNAITSSNKLDYALLSGVPEDNPALVPIEVKTAAGDCIYEVDFTGKAIQKYDLASATAGSNSLEILFTNLANVPSGVAPTIELQIPVTEADVSTISLPAGAQVIDMPDTLAYTSGVIAYHDIVFRAEKDVNDDMVVYCNYAYKFDEEETV